MEPKQLLIPGSAVMNGFCYDYSNALRNKLKQLLTEKGLFDERDNFTRMASAVMHKLAEQTSLPTTGKRIELFIEGVDEFLAIFEI